MTARAPFQFTKDDRRSLRALGLYPEQIDELETNALPYARLVLYQEAHKPRMQDVRRELRALADALAALEEVQTRLEAVSTPTGAPDEDTPEDTQRAYARARLDLASHEVTDQVGDDGVLFKLARMTPLASEIVRRALLNLGSRATRRRMASAAPVQAIHKALERGFERQHRSKVHRNRPDAPFDPIPRYNFEVSDSPGSSFRQIVALCYAAIEAGNDDPDRALRAYTAHLARKAATARQNVADSDDVPS